MWRERSTGGSARLGIGVLTLYAFSVENWKRPITEVSTLMALLKRYLRLELNTLDLRDEWELIAIFAPEAEPEPRALVGRIDDDWELVEIFAPEGEPEPQATIATLDKADDEDDWELVEIFASEGEPEPDAEVAETADEDDDWELVELFAADDEPESEVESEN